MTKQHSATTLAFARVSLMGQEENRRLLGDAQLPSGSIAYTLAGHGYDRDAPLMALDSWRAGVGVTSQELSPERLPSTHVFTDPGMALLLAQRIHSLDEIYYPGFGPLVAKVRVNDDGTGRLLALVVHDSVDGESLHELKAKAAVYGASVEALPVDDFQPTQIPQAREPTDEEVEAWLDQHDRLYKLASRLKPSGPTAADV